MCIRDRVYGVNFLLTALLFLLFTVLISSGSLSRLQSNLVILVCKMCIRDRDNVYYRNHSFNKNFSEYGTPFFSSSVSFTGAAVENRSCLLYTSLGGFAAEKSRALFSREALHSQQK